jgi:outer membrane receptor for ferrienterochelin and colicin
MSEAASSVTIITAEDIQRYGYRTLPDVLASVRGFYISYDRNYAYLGARGFSRPSDYNNRILILVDGNAMTAAAARRLEELARSGDLTEAGSACAELEAALARLELWLLPLVGGAGTGAQTAA